MWDEETPGMRFMQRLVRERAEEMVAAPQYMRFLRHDNETAVRYQKKFGEVWAQHGTNVYKLIAKACGDAPWDSEDEQKSGAVAVGKKVSPLKEKNHDDLARTRQENTRVRFDLLQGKPETGVEVLEEREGDGHEEGDEGEEEEGCESGRRGRREDFYRRAGGGAASPQES